MASRSFRKLGVKLPCPAAAEYSVRDPNRPLIPQLIPETRRQRTDHALHVLWLERAFSAARHCRGARRRLDLNRPARPCVSTPRNRNDNPARAMPAARNRNPLVGAPRVAWGEIMLPVPPITGIEGRPSVLPTPFMVRSLGANNSLDELRIKRSRVPTGNAAGHTAV